MFREGMTGIRINLSHVMLSDCADDIKMIKTAAKECGITPKILIDMQGPELRIGVLSEPVTLCEGGNFILGENGVPVDPLIVRHLESGQEILLDDGRILAEVLSKSGGSVSLEVKRGGVVQGRKSIAIKDHTTDLPALTECDLKNLALAGEFGITGVMQPFVRSADDLKFLRRVLNENGGSEIKIYAKIENMAGVDNLESFFSLF